MTHVADDRTESRRGDSKTQYIVKKKLGEGGQGAVFLVEGPHGSHALKWYVAHQATDAQRAAIRYLVANGPPRGPASQRFIWPQDLVTAAGTPQFGYLMPLIDTSRFAELGQVWARRKPAPGLDVLCEISYQTSNSYRALHLSGHCYRDISQGNLMFDPIAGDVLICDNDNVGINRQSNCQVWGTMQYMAPELVRGEADHPSTETDLHSLAVLLFQLWVWHHPLHGTMEYDVRCWDDPARKKIYGLHAGLHLRSHGRSESAAERSDLRRRGPSLGDLSAVASVAIPPRLHRGTEGTRAAGHGGRMAKPVPPAQGRRDTLPRLSGRQSLGARHDVR